MARLALTRLLLALALVIVGGLSLDRSTAVGQALQPECDSEGYLPSDPSWTLARTEDPTYEYCLNREIEAKVANVPPPPTNVVCYTIPGEPLPVTPSLCPAFEAWISDRLAEINAITNGLNLFEKVIDSVTYADQKIRQAQAALDDAQADLVERLVVVYGAIDGLIAITNEAQDDLYERRKQIDPLKRQAADPLYTILETIDGYLAEVDKPVQDGLSEATRIVDRVESTAALEDARNVVHDYTFGEERDQQCSQTSFERTYPYIARRLPYALRENTVSLDVDDALIAGHHNWNNVRNNCGFADNVSFTFDFKEYSSIGPHSTPDGYNRSDVGDTWGLPCNGAPACAFSFSNYQETRIKECDTRVRYTETYSKEAYEGLQTHEAGHCLRLADLYKDHSRYLTMYYTEPPSGYPAMRTLGVGDINGLRNLFP